MIGGGRRGTLASVTAPPRLADLFARFPNAWFSIAADACAVVHTAHAPDARVPLAEGDAALALLAAAKPINRTQVSRAIRATMKLDGVAAIVVKHPDGSFSFARNFAKATFPLFDRVDLADIAAARFDDVAPEVVRDVAAARASVETMARRALTDDEAAELFRLLGKTSDAATIDAELLVRRMTRTRPDLGAALRASMV
jgi:hypothetical protein